MHVLVTQHAMMASNRTREVDAVRACPFKESRVALPLTTRGVSRRGSRMQVRGALLLLNGLERGGVEHGGIGLGGRGILS